MINILWDFDGTIFDTYPYLVQSFIEISGEDLSEKEVLGKLKINSREAFRHFNISEEKRNLFAKRDVSYSMENSKPFPGIESVLSRSDKNIIVTHRDKKSTQYLLEKFEMLHYFDEIVSVEEAGFKRKPNADSYRYVLQNHKIDLVVGDRELDLAPARETGIRTMAYQNPIIEANFHIADYREFWKHIKKD